MIRKRFYAKLNFAFADDGLEIIHNINSGFYELCQKYLEIALNAQKIKTDDEKISNSFNYSEMEAVKRITIEFLKKNRINNINSLLRIIKLMYRDPELEDEKSLSLKLPKNCLFDQSIYFMGHKVIPDEVFDTLKHDIVIISQD